ncbi:aminoglycoside phosphotransferase family protein [Spirulina major CS-329]|uniref:phosphotransferase enzyme family protein n=1 Tax=Spirulina TaxID=1154 RepID=UPI00232BC518|nr:MULTISPECIES: aminoglycoside phosphotransferase family protein [Spirulina]MDB9496293.1 aminoglycoside phosphotransferase family protein [Spirulina subsalsa CS-330]MDB9502472.1 aminoglycoside phosphotransferase family protein [Spirulina major CS-329]
MLNSFDFFGVFPVSDAIASADAAAHQFQAPGAIESVCPFGSGNVNDTFLVRLHNPQADHFILQRLNTRVFQHPAAVMANMRICTEAMATALQGETLPPGRRWEVPHVVLTTSGGDYYQDAQGSVWRAIAFIDGIAKDCIKTPTEAYEVGYGLGQFHHLIGNVPPDRLADTLPGFHITPLYLATYDQVAAHNAPPRSPESDYCHRFIAEHRAIAPILETAKARGELTLRPIHGDPKVNNLLLDPTTGQAITLVDLDTVKPGLIHYDLGDCLRSGCNPLGEETAAWETVEFDCDRAQIILQGYLDIAQDSLTPADFHYLYDAMRLIAFELGLRFFTDYLAGNRYFKALDSTHNLRRALVQFQLTASIEAQVHQISTLIQSIL